MRDESSIISAFQQGVTAAVAQSDAPALPVRYLMLEFNKPNDQKWLEIVWIPNNDTGAFIGDETNHRGFFRLILHWPNTGGGVYEPVELLASITRYFTSGRLLQGVQIVGKPTPTGSPIESGDETLFPITISYQSYRKGA